MQYAGQLIHILRPDEKYDFVYIVMVDTTSLLQITARRQHRDTLLEDMSMHRDIHATMLFNEFVIIYILTIFNCSHNFEFITEDQ